MKGLDKEKTGIVAVLALVFMTTLVYAYLQYAPSKNDILSVEDDNDFTVSNKDEIIAYKEAYAKRLESMGHGIGQAAEVEKKNEVEIDFSKLLKSNGEKASPVEEVSGLSRNDQEQKTQSQESVTIVQQVGIQKKKAVTTIRKEPKEQDNSQEKTKEDKVSNTVFVRSTFQQKQATPTNTSLLTTNKEIHIPAIVYGDQKVKPGAMVRMRTTRAVSIDGIGIPANTFVFGKVKLAKERIYIEAEGMETGQGPIPVQLSAYDIDGMEGLYAPERMEHAIAKDAKNSALNGVQSTVNIPVIGSISLNAGKRKLSDMEVKIPNRYKLILKAK